MLIYDLNFGVWISRVVCLFGIKRLIPRINLVSEQPHF